MRFHALASDYDGTLAFHGKVGPDTVAALERLKTSGRKLILVTGRRLDDLFDVFEHAHLFDRIVAENGGLLYRPDTGEEKPLAEAPPDALIRLLRERRVEPLAVGRVLLATLDAHDKTVLEAIEDLGVEMEIILNKGAVMVLPTGVNKATGLDAALKDLGLSPGGVVGVGDAENDLDFLDLCGCAVAVADALPAVKSGADLVTKGENGEGVAELVERWLATGLSEIESGLSGEHAQRKPGKK
jgi:HAD superfamily hydrolase (TIGR01484 family)